VQFVVSTHSPIIVVGASDIAQVVQLDDDYVPTELSNMNVGQILLSEMFNLKSLFSPQWDDALSRRDQLLALPSLSDDEREELEQLDRKLASLSECDSSNIARNNLLVSAIAQKLGIEL
jgi:hypothetical protein